MPTEYSSRRVHVCMNQLFYLIILSSVIWHLCNHPCRNRAEAAKFLLGVDANANAKISNPIKGTPVIIAASKGCTKVLEALVGHPTIDLSVQVW